MGDSVCCRRCDFEIDDSPVIVTTTQTDCIQFRRSVRPKRIVSCLGANMKNYATCEYRNDHSLCPVLREYLFQVANALLTVPRAVGNLAGNPILLQLENTEVKGSS